MVCPQEVLRVSWKQINVKYPSFRKEDVKSKNNSSIKKEISF